MNTYNTSVMRFYQFIKDFLVYSVLGFVIIPIKLIVTLMSGNGLVANLNAICAVLQPDEQGHGGGGLAFGIIWRVFMWGTIALLSLCVFASLSQLCAPALKDLSFQSISKPLNIHHNSEDSTKSTTKQNK